MNEKPFDINRLFFIAKTQLNYSRQEFFDSTFKEIAMLIEELNKELNEHVNNQNYNNQDEYIEKIFSIDQIPFL